MFASSYMFTFKNLRLISITYSNIYYAFECIIYPKIMPYYAVAKGIKPGVYKTWNECKQQIDGFKNARYKKFEDETEAKLFVNSTGFITVPEKVTDDLPSLSDSDDCIFMQALPEENKFSPLLSRINALEEQLTFAVTEIKSIKSYIQGLGAPSSSKNEFVQKRKLSTDTYAGKPPKKDKPDDVDGSCFKYDADGFVEVYTDGACEKNGKANAKAGLGVFFGEGHPLNRAEPVSGRATNNCGEIQAAIKAIKLAKSAGVSKICIYTDSQFLINSMTQWVKGWKRKGWKLADGNPVKNKIDFEELDREVQNIHVKWTYVKAHCGIFGNEMADELARQGAEMYRSKS